MKFWLVNLFLILLSFTELYSQEKIKYKADELKFRRINKEPVRKLIKNVIFKQGDTEIKCDSANFFNKRNVMEAYGNVIITNSDSSIITSNLLIYDGNDKIAKLRENVIYVKNNEEIKTDNLNYYIEIKKGEYFGGGELRDETNKLSSEIGIFYGDKDISLFYNNVEFVGDDYVLQSDSMTYNSQINEARTFGYTEILSNDSVYVEALGGRFRQTKNRSNLRSSKIETNKYILEAKFIDLDDNKSLYEAKENVILKIKESDYLVTGNSGFYDKKNNTTKIFGDVLLKKNIKNDTFYLSSDTILAIDDNKEVSILYAYNNVKFYKNNFIGKSDSILFLIKDSTIYMYDDPIVWNGNNQITSDTINFKIYSDKIEEMNLSKNAFIISKDTIDNFNQIKGRNMKATFLDNNYIESIEVTGNGETIYFALNEESNIILGLNYIICSDLKLNFINNDVDNIIFYKNPKAKLIPPHEIKDEDLYIDSFNWREDERPKINDVVHYLRKKIYLRNDLHFKN